MSNIVTGGSGLIGSEFSNKYIKLSSKDVNLINQKDVDLFFEEEKPDNVIHCAAKVGGVNANMKYKGDFFYENVMINTNVIEACKKFSVKKLVCFLSTCIFPDKIDYPLTEGKIHLGPPHFSNDAYAYAKRMADIQIKSYKEQYGLDYKSVIPCNVYGPNDNYNIENGHVLPAIIHKCYIAKQNNTPLTIWGNGEALREFIFSRDVAFLSEWVLENYKEEEPIILSSNEEVSIKEVVNLVVELMEFEGKVIWDESKPNGQYRKPSDNSKIKKYLPNFKFTSLKDGLKETVNFVKSNYSIIRK
jgi:GDP-L-fucose synthase